MSFTASTALIAATSEPSLEDYRNAAKTRRSDREFEIETGSLDANAIADLLAAATAVGDKKAVRAVESIFLARSGNFDRPVPNFKAFKEVLAAFLKSNCIDGWLYAEERDGKMYPQLVTGIAFDTGYNNDTPTVRVHTISYGCKADRGASLAIVERSHRFTPQSVVNRRVSDILSASGLYKETQALRQAHMASVERHYQVTRDAFAKQFRVNGAAYYFEAERHNRLGLEFSRRRVIHDLAAIDREPALLHAESILFAGNPDAGGFGLVPEHPLIRVFDLSTHEFFWVHADNMEPYEYDKTLRNKLILPQTHRDLLDVLTNDLGAFVGDIIEGKSADNIILCKGVPGVGKTLTAEVYAELIDRPLYSIRSGALGTTAQDIEQNLAIIFQQSKRWGCVLLLDEADVFVIKRGDNIEQNAIVAEFLRVLEYFDGLLFMTTNRPDDIDDAILSRCAAIIDFAPPPPTDAAAIWRVMAAHYEADLSDELIWQLVALFPQIPPRDIKLLMRLALRITAAKKEPLTLDTFRRCAMFRAIKMQDASEQAP